VSNAGRAAFVGVTVDFLANQSSGGDGGTGGAAGKGFGGSGGDGTTGGNGGDGVSGLIGSGGNGGAGSGGGAANQSGGILVINPRLGAKKNSKQARASSLFTANQALGGRGGSFGAVGNGNGGSGGTPGGTPGTGVIKLSIVPSTAGKGIGGGLNLDAAGSATIKDTSVTGNQASTSNNDVAGTFTS
jgi:hypothetical protein